MSYDASDPRAALQAPAPAAPRTGLTAQEQAGFFLSDPPVLVTATERNWFLRGCNFVLVWTECGPGADLPRSGQPDEYVVLLHDPGTRARIDWQDESLDLTGPVIAFVPAGDSRITLPDGGRLTRLFTAQSADLVALAPNAAAYDRPRVHIPPFAPWPDPPGGWHLRSHSLDVPPEPGRFGRIFRCTTFMVNVLDPMVGPRDPARMSPHHHDDFEQCSLALGGVFVHHLRWPWTTDMADWQPDRHVEMGAPSALVIPPPVIHTSQAVGAGNNDLVDIFCPPRRDFSDRPGWVLNAGDYPAPGPAPDRGRPAG